MALEWTGKFTPRWGGEGAWEKDEDGLLLRYEGLLNEDNGNLTLRGRYVLVDHGGEGVG